MADLPEPAAGSAAWQKSFYACATFLFCALLWNPVIFAPQSGVRTLPMFTAGALGLLAAGLVLLAPERIRRAAKFMSAAALGFLLLVLGQFAFHFSGWTIAQLGEGLFWIAVPLAVFVHPQAFRKLLPVYVLAIGAYAACYSAVPGLRGQWSAGITGNENWTAALFAMTMIFLGGSILGQGDRGSKPERKKLIIGLGIAAEIVLVWLFCRIGSKGAWLALVLTAALFGWLRAGAKLRKILAAAALLCLLAGSVWLVRHTDAAARFIHDDGRVILWENAASLIADHPLFGVGQGSYENEYMTYRKADYFLLKNPASRSTHPHSHLLFIAGSWGIAGLILWGILLFAPLAVMIRRLYRRENVDPLDTVCFLTLVYALLHGSLDLILVAMPTGLIALLCLGMLWNGMTGPEQPAKPFPCPGLRLAGAAVMAAFSLLAVWRSAHAALQVRRAYRNELMPDEIIRTVRQCPGEYQANYALLNYLAKRNAPPEIQLAVTEVMLGSHTPNYPGLHLGRGNALMRLGRFGEAAQMYRIEADLFPLSLRPIYNLIVAVRSQGDLQLAAKYEEELRARMQVRGNDERDLRIILTGKNGAHYDLRPHEKPAE
ncbi:MAG: O-antigen ligase family protein [Lentisphaeria bacterium]|nr:O-antigen ligase family protein [Lentisphaeria bacterium]